MNDNKKPDEKPEIKELLTHQLQLVSKESEEAHGETLAALSSAAADLAQAVAACSRALVYAFPGNAENTYIDYGRDAASYVWVFRVRNIWSTYEQHWYQHSKSWSQVGGITRSKRNYPLSRNG